MFLTTMESLKIMCCGAWGIGQPVRTVRKGLNLTMSEGEEGSVPVTGAVSWGDLWGPVAGRSRLIHEF